MRLFISGRCASKNLHSKNSDRFRPAPRLSRRLSSDMLIALQEFGNPSFLIVFSPNKAFCSFINGLYCLPSFSILNRLVRLIRCDNLFAALGDKLPTVLTVLSIVKY